MNIFSTKHILLQLTVLLLLIISTFSQAANNLSSIEGQWIITPGRVVSEYESSSHDYNPIPKILIKGGKIVMGDKNEIFKDIKYHADLNILEIDTGFFSKMKMKFKNGNKLSVVNKIYTYINMGKEKDNSDASSLCEPFLERNKERINTYYKAVEKIGKWQIEQGNNLRKRCEGKPTPCAGTVGSAFKECLESLSSK